MVEADVSCEAVTGHAASFVTQVSVSVDGAVVAVRDGDLSSFTIPLGMHGDHTVSVYDRTAGNDWDREHGETAHGGPGANLVLSVQVSCPERSTTTTEAPTTTVVDTTVAARPVPHVDVEPSTTVLVAFPPELETTTVQTTAVVQQSTPATLPATGSASGTELGVGLMIGLFGLMMVGAARRRPV